MNLLEAMKSEVLKLKLTDKLKIAQYIYIRTGELFEYDPLWIFSTPDEREALKYKRIDINNVNDFDITCYSWSRMYVELLQAFGIVARVKYVDDNFYGRQTLTLEPSTTHAFVEIVLNGRIYISDLTASFKDLIAIKLGLDTFYNSQLSKKFGEEKYQFSKVSEDIDRYRKSIKQALQIIKNKLDIKKAKQNNEEYIYKIYELIGSIIELSGMQSGFVIGTKSIDFLLKYFIGENYKISNKYFFDKEKSTYIKVYEISINGNPRYFSYSKIPSGLYELQEVTREQVNIYSQMYKTRLSKPNKKKSQEGFEKVK